MNQLVLVSIAVALFSGAALFGGSGQSENNVLWIIFLGSAAAGAYFFMKNRGRYREESTTRDSSSRD
ncbi:MAG: hypothetical protein WBG92_18390 [Thiohalocapsa sp.]